MNPEWITAIVGLVAVLGPAVAFVVGQITERAKRDREAEIARLLAAAPVPLQRR